MNTKDVIGAAIEAIREVHGAGLAIETIQFEVVIKRKEV